MIPKHIHEAAERYAENECSAYTNDYNGFVNGAIFAMSELKPLIDAAREVVNDTPTGTLKKFISILRLQQQLEQFDQMNKE